MLSPGPPGSYAATSSKTRVCCRQMLYLGTEAPGNAPCGVFVCRVTMRSGSGKASGFRSTVSTTLKMAVLAPIPSARAAMAVMVKPGLCRKTRMECRISLDKVPMGLLDGAGARRCPYNRRKALTCMFLRVVLGCALVLSLAAQTPSGATSVAARADKPAASVAQAQRPGEAIQVQVNEVIVPVTVTDDKGRFVSDLEQKDFRIFDEGKEQKIEYFSRERSQPVVVGFLIDMSNTSRLNWKNYKDAAIELVDTLMPGDKKFSGYLLSYSSEAEVLV